jgi:hypothetical protein
MGLEHLSRNDDDPWPTDETVAEGGGTLEMAGDLTREELAAHLAAADARTDTKFERMLGEMRTGFARLETKIDVRFAEQEAKMDVRFAEQEAKIEVRFADFESRMDIRFADFESRIDRRFISFQSDIDVRFAEFSGSVNTRFAETNARIDAKPSVTQLWAVMGTAAGLGLAMVGVIFTSVQWLDARQAERNALRSPPALHSPAQP